MTASRKFIASWLPSSNTLRVLPLLVLFIVIFDLPMVSMLGRSVISPTDGLTGGYFGEIWSTPAYRRILVDTFRVSAIATIACAILGYPLAYWMLKLGPRGRNITIAMVLVTFWVSILVRTYAWIVVLGNAGIVNRFLQWSGLTVEPVSLLYSEFGVTLGMTNVLLPFFVLPIFAAMLRIDNRLLQAAASLGASPFTIFWRIFFPLTIPALAASMLLLFMLSLGFYVTPAILGGGKVPMVGNLLDMLINETSQWEVAAALSALLLGLTIAVFLLYTRFEKQGRVNP